MGTGFHAQLPLLPPAPAPLSREYRVEKRGGANLCLLQAQVAQAWPLTTARWFDRPRRGEGRRAERAVPSRLHAHGCELQVGRFADCTPWSRSTCSPVPNISCKLVLIVKSDEMRAVWGREKSLHF